MAQTRSHGRPLSPEETRVRVQLRKWGKLLVQGFSTFSQGRGQVPGAQDLSPQGSEYIHLPDPSLTSLAPPHSHSTPYISAPSTVKYGSRPLLPLRTVLLWG